MENVSSSQTNLRPTYSYISLSRFDMDQGEGNVGEGGSSVSVPEDVPNDVTSFPRSLIPGTLQTLSFRHVSLFFSIFNSVYLVFYVA